LLELAASTSAIYQRRVKEPEFEPGTVIDTDRVVTRGTGNYHQAKRGAAK
jgi:phenylalanine-4-hydroxylase